MIRIFHMVLWGWVLIWPLSLPAFAEDEGFIVEILQEALSGAGRDVDIIGFEGALSSTAKMQGLRISDQNGVWLEAYDLLLDWRQAAVLGGRIEIKQIKAGKIIIHRPPLKGEQDNIAPETSPFSLPDLPVSISIGALQIDKLTLHEPVMGIALELTAHGNARLADGAGSVALLLNRVDGPIGIIELAGAFSPTDRALRLKLEMTEEANGIVAKKLNIPNAPALRLELSGEAPIDDFTARLQLSAEGQSKLRGQFRQRFDENNAAHWSGTITGDLAALLAPDHRAFFGDAQRLEFEAMRRADGTTHIPLLALNTAKMNIGGTIDLEATGRPFAFDLSGEIQSTDGTDVRLPFAGDGIFLTKAAFSAKLDRAVRPDMNVLAKIDTLKTPGAQFPKIAANLEGLITRGSFDAQLNISAETILWQAPQLSTAIGPNFNAKFDIKEAADNKWHLSNLIFATDTARLSGDVQFQLSDVQSQASFDVSVRSDRLEAFAPLISQELTGAAQFQLSGTATPLSGEFDIDLAGNTTKLAIGQAQIDPALAPPTQLSASIARNDTGISLRSLKVENTLASIAVKGQFSSQVAFLRLTSRINDVVTWTPQTAPVPWGGGVELSADIDLANGRLSRGNLVLRGLGKGFQISRGSEIITGTDPSMRLGLANHNWTLSGGMTHLTHPQGRLNDIVFEGTGALKLGRDHLPELVQGTLVLNTDITLTKDETLNKVVYGQHSINIAATYSKKDGLFVRDARLSSPQITSRASGNIPNDFSYSAQFNDLSRLIPEFPGQLRASGALKKVGPSNWTILTELTGPNDGKATLSGRASSVDQLKLSLTGRLPLAYGNPWLTPNRAIGTAILDLRLDGRPSFDAIAGRILTENARVSVPILGTNLEQFGASLEMRKGLVSLAAQANVAAGGELSLSGDIDPLSTKKITLSGALKNIVLTDPKLYYTRVKGPFALDGPLNAPSISANLEFKETEIRIPETGLSAFTSIPDLIHENASSAVQDTLRRAGLAIRPRLRSDNEPASSAALPLDIAISVPSRLFIRGRGLDAELGGSMRIGGTSQDIEPRGALLLKRGRISILNENYALSEGAITLQGDLDPKLNFRADLNREDFIISTHIEGSASTPIIRFSSAPSLPEDEVFAQLVFGRNLEELSALQALQLLNAIAQLTGNTTNTLFSGIRKSLLLDQLNISQTEDGTAAITAGKYISKNVYTDLSLASDGTQRINLNIDINKNLRMRGSSDTDSHAGVGIFYEVDY